MRRIEKRELLKIQKLQERIDELLRIAEGGEVIKIVDRGKVVAELTPPGETEPANEQDAAWEDLKRLSVELSAHWPEGISAVDAVRDVRRDL